MFLIVLRIVYAKESVNGGFLASGSSPGEASDWPAVPSGRGGQSPSLSIALLPSPRSSAVRHRNLPVRWDQH
jgi:hypothetical protein